MPISRRNGSGREGITSTRSEVKRRLSYRLVHSSRSGDECADSVAVRIPRKCNFLATASEEKGLVAREITNSKKLSKLRRRNSTSRTIVWPRADDLARSRRRTKAPIVIITKAERHGPKCYSMKSRWGRWRKVINDRLTRLFPANRNCYSLTLSRNFKCIYRMRSYLYLQLIAHVLP